MKISVEISDSSASEILQNYSAAQGWSELTDAEVSSKVAEQFTDQLLKGAVRGSSILSARTAEQELSERLSATVSGVVG